ncbi:hypothetical protein ACFLSS_04405, partial [Bacteroidota bacterium]
MYFLLSKTGKIIRLNSAAREIFKETNHENEFPEIFDLIELCDRNDTVNIFNRCINDNVSSQYQTRFFFNKKLIDINLSFSQPIRNSGK